MVSTAPGRVPFPGLLWLRVSVLSAAVLNWRHPAKSLRVLGSVKPWLYNSTVNCDVIKRDWPALSQTSRGQRGKKERKRGTRLGSTKFTAPKRPMKTKIECLRVTSLKIKFVKLLHLSGGQHQKACLSKPSFSGKIVSIPNDPIQNLFKFSTRQAGAGGSRSKPSMDQNRPH